MTNILSLQGLPVEKGPNTDGVMASSYSYSACSTVSSGC